MTRAHLILWLKKERKTLLYVHLGCLMYALSITLFVTPLKLPGSGITGLSLILLYTLDVPLWLSNLILNGALLLYGYQVLPKRFFWWSAYSTLLISLLYPLTALLPPPPMTDPMAVVLAGGVLQGFALAIVFSTGASSGGTDIVVGALKRKHGLEVGTLSMWINFAVIALFIPITRFELMVYAVLMTYVKGVVLNNDVRSFATRKEALILPTRPDAVKDFIVHDLGRGVTVFDARGGYDGAPHQVLITLLSPRQAVRLKFFLREHDPKAFLRIGEVTEVLGRGFGSLNRDL